MTATTALTAQNTQGVSGIHQIPPDFVVKQIDACLNDIGVDVVKIGMLASAETVDLVASALQRHGRPTAVVDPVMVSTSGAQLLPDEAVFNLRTRLLPLTTILTPNIPEARLLLQNAGINVPDINEIDDIVNIAKALNRLGPRYVLIKGGHLPLTKDGRISLQEADRHTIVDVLYDGDQVILYETDYLPSKNTHGTGCSLACKNSQCALWHIYSPLRCPILHISTRYLELASLVVSTVHCCFPHNTIYDCRAESSYSSHSMRHCPLKQPEPHPPSSRDGLSVH